MSRDEPVGGEPERPSAADGPAHASVIWAGMVLLTLVGLLSAFVETLLVPLYAGGVVVPVAVVLAIAGNIALSRMARVLVPRGFAVLGPFAAWLVVVIGFGAIARPEGDVILPGAPAAVQYVVYAMLLGGALAAVVTLVVTAPPPPPRDRPAGSSPGPRDGAKGPPPRSTRR